MNDDLHKKPDEESNQPSDQSIDYFSRNHPLRGVASKIASKARKKMFNLFMETLKPDKNTKILDVGVTPDTELADSNFFERLYPHKENIVATSVEDAAIAMKQFPGVTFIQTDKINLPFEDKSFDIVFCSAVLEHVGTRYQQQQFVNELLRVSKSFFFTTPNRFFPIEVHTFIPLIHWLPQPWHQFLLRHMGMKFWAETENLNLLSSRDFRQLFNNSKMAHLKKNFLLGMPSNLIMFGKS